MGGNETPRVNGRTKHFSPTERRNPLQTPLDRNESAPIPFLIRRDVGNNGHGSILRVGPCPMPSTRYYLWLFGLKFKVYGDPEWTYYEEL